MKKMKLSDIVISDAFANSIPKECKMEKCRKNWNECHRQDRYLLVNHCNVLIDGYIQYLILKENGIEEAIVKISERNKKCWNRKNIEIWNIPNYKNEETTYIYGMHYNIKQSKFSKEYVWRIPKKWSENGWEEENDLHIGDSVLVSTKYGLVPITISRIERLNKCPVNFSVKKIVKKLV